MQVQCKQPTKMSGDLETSKRIRLEVFYIWAANKCYYMIRGLSYGVLSKVQSASRKAGMFEKQSLCISICIFFNDKKIKYKIIQTIKNSNPSKRLLVCNKERKRIKNVEQKLVNFETQNFKKSLKSVEWRC